MQPNEFSDRSPGKLASTTFAEPYRKNGVVQTRTVPGVGFVPDPLPPGIDWKGILFELQEPLLAAQRSLGVLEGSGRQLKNPHLLIGPLVRREAKLSSAIENTFASAEQLALFEFDESAVSNRSEVREVFNYVRALEHGLRSELPVCLRLIKQMHAILLDGVATPGMRPGEFRKTQNAIGKEGSPFADARFVPPPPEFLPECLNRLEAYLHASDSLPKLVRLALIHYQFEAIHPFDDGNGRLGRLLIVLLLCEQNQMSKPLVYVSGYFEQHRQRYYDLLYRVSTEGRWTEWVAFFLEALETQAADSVARAARLAELREQYQEAVREKRASALLPKIVDRLFERPSITVADAMTLTGVNATPAMNAILKLVQKGILVEATGRKKDRIYVAPAILDIIDR